MIDIGPFLIVLGLAGLAFRYIGYKAGFNDGYAKGRKEGYQNGWLRGTEAERRARQEDEEDKQYNPEETQILS